MSVESSLDGDVVDMEPTDTTMDSNAVLGELSHAIAARHVHMTEEEVQVETRKKILMFHTCVKDLLKLEQKYGSTAINSVMRVLLADEDVTRCFKRNPNVQLIREMDLDVDEVNIFAGGFTKVRAELSDGLIFDYYTKNPCNVISGQVSLIKRAAILDVPGKEKDIVNPVNAMLGLESVDVVRQLVDNHASSEVRWWNPIEDGETSMVGFLQLYSDKSKTTMKVNGLTFYPLHVKLMNVVEEWGNYFVEHSKTVVAYLPVQYYKRDAEDRIVPDLDVTRLQKMKAVHYTIETVMKPVADIAYKGLACRTVDEEYIRLHLAIGAYCGDTVEVKDMLCIKHGHRTAQPCTRCHVTCEDMAKPTKELYRTKEETDAILESHSSLMEDAGKITWNMPEDARKMRETANELVDMRSMHPIAPLLSKFPFVGCTDSLDIYNIFSVEPLHVFHLGISRMLKQSMCDMLLSKEKFTDRTGKVSASMKSYSYIRSSVIKHLNRFIIDATSITTEQPCAPAMMNADGRPGMNGYFNDDGFSGMLEAVNIRKLDQISPFFGVLVDRACGLERQAPVTDVFMRYVVIMQAVCGLRGHYVMSPECIANLRAEIRIFKKKAVDLFGEVHASGLGTMKWHLLDHVCDDIIRLGGLYLNDAGLYEGSHKAFKRAYHATSQRSRSCMDESVKLMGRNIAMDGGPSEKRRRTIDAGHWAKACPGKHVSAIQKDSGCAARPYMSIGAVDLLKTKSVAEGKLEMELGLEEVQLMDKCRDVLQYLHAIGRNAHRTFIKLIEELLDVSRLSESLIAQFRIYFCRSAYISGMESPDIRDLDKGKKVYVWETGRRKLQRVFATHKFYGTTRARFDSVMVHVSVVQQSGHVKYQVWFAKVLGIVDIKSTMGRRYATGECMAHLKKSCDICDRKIEGEYAFLQYYDVLSDEELPVDTVDKKLGCIRLVWDRHGASSNAMGPGKMYALTPLDSIRGRVNVVRATELVSMLHSDGHYKKKLVSLLGDSSGWESELFYVNRFQCDGDATFDLMQESTVGSVVDMHQNEGAESMC